MSALRFCRWVLTALVVGGWPSFGKAEETILVLYSDSRTLAAISLFDDKLRATLRANPSANVDIISEFLELGRYPADVYPALVTAFLREKYRNTKLLAVIAGGPLALEFLLQHGAEIFPHTTVVHAYVDRAWLADKALPTNFIGIPAQFEVAKTADIALHLHPKARRVVVITGGGPTDQHLRLFFRRDANRYAGRAAFEFWDGLPMTDVLRRLAALPADSIVLTSSVLRDGTGKWFTGQESTKLMAAVSSAPIYGIISAQVGSGLVGGHMPKIEETGAIVASIVLRLAAGEKLTSASLPASQPSYYIFDWRQLQRWGVADDRLPAGSVILFKDPSLWEKYRWQIIVGGVLAVVIIALCIAEAFLIAKFVAERRARQQSEEDLRESERQMSLAANAAGLAPWLWDLSTNSIVVSERGASLLGVRNDEAISFERFLSMVHPDDRETARIEMDRMRVDRVEFDHEMRILRSDGSVRWIDSWGRAEFGGDGRTVRVRGVAVDVTARKEAQAEARHHRDQAAHLSRVSILGQLSGALAHELNQPLSAILSNAEAAQRYLAQDKVNSDELREILADIISDDRRAGAVIERLRALLKRGESEHRTLSLNDLVRDVERLCRSDLVTRNTQLEPQLTPELPPVKGDKVQLEQVLLNLVVNACDAMEECDPGKRLITIRTEPVDGEGVLVTVSDRGPGLPLDGSERVFEPFVTSKVKGMGLGLSISRSIVAAHGGRLWAANSEAGGAMFCFTLPADSIAEAA
nr:ATP-binding protein [Nitrosomonas nitrosa]